MRRYALMLWCLALLGVSCSSGTPQATPRPTDPPDLQSEGCPDGPCIGIVSPEPLALVRGGKVPIATKVTNFKLVDKIGKKAKKGEGHIVFYRLESLDAEVPTKKGKSVLVGGAGSYTAYPGAKTSYTWPNTPSKYTPPGGYTFVVQLVNNDNTPLSPPQVAKIALNVQR